MGRGRPRDPKTKWRMKPHKVGANTYASTTEYTSRDGAEKAKYRYIHWGRLDSNLRFEPNRAFCLLDANERAQFIWPDEWDRSGVEQAVLAAQAMQTAIEQNKEYTLVSSDKLYGHVWVLEQVAKRIGLLEDLTTVFNGNTSMANDVLSLAMYMVIERRATNHMVDSQLIVHYPSLHVLLPSTITELFKSIGTKEATEFYRLRIERLEPGMWILAVDSTSRNGYSLHLANMEWGRSKDGMPLPQTLEVVACSLSDHMPLYVCCLPGNMPDSRAFPLLLQNLRGVGLNKAIIVIDRGYECIRTIQLCVRMGQPVITAARVRQKRILAKIREIGEPGDVPSGMEWLPERRIFAAQYELSMDVRDPATQEIIQADRFHLNLYYDPARRVQELGDLLDERFEQEQFLTALKESGGTLPDSKRRKANLFDVERDAENHVLSWELNGVKWRHRSETFGFFASMTLGVDFTAPETLEHYKTRDEQEKFFNVDKTGISANRQRSSNELAAQGRRFVEFVALVLLCYVRNALATDEKLRKAASNLTQLFAKMASIHYIERSDGSHTLTPFVGKQLVICKQLGLTVPSDCSPLYTNQETPGSRKREFRKT